MWKKYKVELRMTGYFAAGAARRGRQVNEIMRSAKAEECV